MPKRVLVLDECGLQRFVLGKLCPSETELLSLASFEEAMRLLRDDPPDAAVVSMPPAEIDWKAFQHLCASASPPVPVLYESCVFESPREMGLDPFEGYAELLRKPASPYALRDAMRRLLELAGEGHVVGSRPAAGG